MTYIAYLPESIAGRPSALREQAYLEGKSLAPPMLDQGGWKSLSLLEAVGTIAPNATVTAQLSIATPVRLLLKLRLLIGAYVCFIWISCHLRWAHRYHYSFTCMLTRLHTLNSIRLMFVSSALSLRAALAAACAGLMWRAAFSGRLLTTLLTR